VKLEPTREQLEAIAVAIARASTPDGHVAPRAQGRAAWDVIAPLVLEAAAKVCEEAAGKYGTWDYACAVLGERIREMAKGEP